MSDHLNNLIFGLAVAFALPAACFVLGMMWSKAIGGWGDLKFKRWWATFCLALPFLFLGMMTKRIAEDNFQTLREVWAAEPLQLVTLSVLAIVLSIVAIVGIMRVWHSSRPAND